MSKSEKPAPTPGAASPSADRRRLLRAAIKGAAIAPAVITLKSGNAWAQAASSCFARTYNVTRTGAQNQFLSVTLKNGTVVTRSQIQNSSACWDSGNPGFNFSDIRPIN